MKQLKTSQLLLSLLGSMFGVIIMGLVFVTVSSVVAAPATAPPGGNPEFPLTGTPGAQGPQGATGATGATGQQGPPGPAGTGRAPSQTITLNPGSNTTYHRCTNRNVQSECGDADGCTIRMVLDHKLDGWDQVHILESDIYMENFATNLSNTSS